jgi:hypothetical protein
MKDGGMVLDHSEKKITCMVLSVLLSWIVICCGLVDVDIFTAMRTENLIYGFDY